MWIWSQANPPDDKVTDFQKHKSSVKTEVHYGIGEGRNIWVEEESRPEDSRAGSGKFPIVLTLPPQRAFQWVIYQPLRTAFLLITYYLYLNQLRQQDNYSVR